MKNITLCVLTLIAVGSIFVYTAARSAEDTSTVHYEYASVRYQGGQKTSIVWPDGRVEKISNLNNAKRPDTADERMFYLTIAVNLLAKQGFEFVNVPMLGNPDDIFARRAIRR